MSKNRHPLGCCLSLRCVLFLICTSGHSVFAQIAEYQGQTASGAYYSMAIPDAWQPADGLVIWNHGYQGYTTTSPGSNPSLGPLEDIVISQGFAIAASSYSQTGWAVFSSHVDNQQLYETFVEIAGKPEKLFVQGASLGGIVSLRDLEAKLLPEVDGALLLCGAVAGPINWIEAFDLRMVYEAVCDDVSHAKLPTDSWTEQPDPIAGEVQFLDSLERCTGLISSDLLGDDLDPFLQDPEKRERLNKILSLTDTDIDFLLLNLGYAVFEIPSLTNDPSKLDGLRAFGNAGVDYGDEEINRVIQRSVALPSSRQFLLDNYTPNGDIGDTKLVSIHTSKDGLVRVENQRALIDLVAPGQLTTAIVVEDEASHCGFSEEEGLAAWNQLLAWSGGAAQPSVQDLQESCEQSSNGPTQCRYDPEFQLAESLLTFPREIAAETSDSISYDSADSLISIESLQIVGAGQAYSVELNVPAQNSSIFTVKSVETISSTDEWRHQALYFADDSLLYLPKLRVLPYSENDDRFDVYMRYSSDKGQEGLELIEYEIAR